MKRALVVSPYFLPCNLAGVHRPRLLASGLPEFSWEPIVLTVHPRHYGSLREPNLEELIPNGLRLEYVEPMSASLSRLLGVGDLALRAYWQMRARMRELIRTGQVDLIFVSVLPGYAGLLGGWAKRRFGMPFVLDYQDPWVSDWGATQPRFSKSGLAHRLAAMLEPRFAPFADAVTAVSNATLDGLRRRGLLDPKTPTAELPIGSDPGDHEVARRVGKSCLEKQPGLFHVAYLGTIPEKKLSIIRAIFRALGQSSAARTLCFHFIGTSGTVDGQDSMGLERIAAQAGVSNFVRIEPRRMPYLDALRTMQEADALFMLGSIERHYTASKLFPYWLAQRPIVGVAHEESSVIEIARQLGGIRLCHYSGKNDVDAAAAGLIELVAALQTKQPNLVPPRNPAAFEPYGARGISRVYAEIFDQVIQITAPSN